MQHDSTESTAWAGFSRRELERKRKVLVELVDSGMLSARSADQQRMEIAFISRELERRQGDTRQERPPISE